MTTSTEEGAVDLKRRPLPEQLRYVAGKLAEGDFPSPAAAALVLCGMADALTESTPDGGQESHTGAMDGPLVSPDGPERSGAPEAAQGDGLPEGIYARVEMPGYRQHTGWVTEETRFGAQVAVIRDWDSRPVAEVAFGPGCQLVHLPTPRKRPDAPLAVTDGSEDDGRDEWSHAFTPDSEVPF